MPPDQGSGQASGDGGNGNGGTDGGAGAGSAGSGGGGGAGASSEITPERALEIVKELGLAEGPDGKNFDPERAVETIRKLRPYEKQVGSLQKELNAAQAKLKEFEDKDKTDLERAQSQASDLERQKSALELRVTELELERKIEGAAQAAGAKRPSAVARFINPADVQRDDHGEPTNLDKLIEKVAEDVPELFTGKGPGSGDGGPRGPTGPAKDMNALIREAAGRG